MESPMRRLTLAALLSIFPPTASFADSIMQTEFLKGDAETQALLQLEPDRLDELFSEDLKNFEVDQTLLGNVLCHSIAKNRYDLVTWILKETTSKLDQKTCFLIPSNDGINKYGHTPLSLALTLMSVFGFQNVRSLIASGRFDLNTPYQYERREPGGGGISIELGTPLYLAAVTYVRLKMHSKDTTPLLSLIFFLMSHGVDIQKPFNVQFNFCDCDRDLWGNRLEKTESYPKNFADRFYQLSGDSVLQSLFEAKEES